MLTKKEKLAVWLIVITNPIFGWSVTYLLWHESQPEKQRYAAQAALYAFILFVAIFILFFAAGIAGK